MDRLLVPVVACILLAFGFACVLTTFPTLLPLLQMPKTPVAPELNVPESPAALPKVLPQQTRSKLTSLTIGSGAAKTVGAQHAAEASAAAASNPELILTQKCAEGVELPVLSCIDHGSLVGIQARFGALPGGCRTAYDHDAAETSEACVRDVSMYIMDRCMGSKKCSLHRTSPMPKGSCPPRESLRHVVTYQCLTKPAGVVEPSKSPHVQKPPASNLTPEAGRLVNLRLVQKLRILIFITTHLSGSHMQFLQRCWPSLANNLALVQHADVMLSSAKPVPESMLREFFPGKNVTVRLFKNPGYQRGAMLSMEQGLLEHWFSGYDWVIRVNPDVIILEDDWLIKTMLDQNAAGIFTDCKSRCTEPFCTIPSHNSDFFAFRVSEMPSDAFSRYSSSASAESQAKLAFFHMYISGKDRWLPGTRQGNLCRVRGPYTPVLHSHSLVKSCPLKPGEPKDRSMS